ncbi:hypothetical protein ED236_06605 [Pseudomethylobacillus aquaticus]|uniref:Uncharacterized protein n=1 Tax=Pseudomethylobacillus aquaticus TaxID=2676064 RepID=A0A3N0V0X3_9PROT|nr:STY4851/ECs_5259 family protein [Pseudomethylobacillus aquaticus]ROH86128.1 hypothetical protein ED236_06605 [Pseudomethylobacillus aquaticus]
MRFDEWRNAFLAKNNRQGLNEGLLNGAPLYSYKMTAEEFMSLQHCLASNLEIYLSHYQIDEICKKSSYFSPLFVLYAANWWQRKYDGTGMSWDPIFTSIGIDYSELNSVTRSEMIESGFREWNLALNADIGNLKFIGNIASQGGLPLNLIASGRGNLNRLLNRVLKDTVNLGFPDEKSILSIIESHRGELPKSYRQPLIFSLLAEIIITFVHFKNDANLSGALNPLEKLDQHKSNWRDSFPLPMDDENARGVLERFIQEGVKIKADKLAFSLTLQRYLHTLDGIFNVEARIDFPKNNIDQESVIKAFDIAEGFITRVMLLQVSNQAEKHEITLGRLAGQLNYRFNLETTPLFKHAHEEHVAILKNADNVRKNITLANGFELDDDTPWVFDADSEGDEGKFLKIGGGKFRSPSLYVVVPARFHLQALSEMSSFEPIAWSRDREKKCYVIDVPVACLSDEDEQYEIKPSCGDADEEDFALMGNRIWHVFQKPAIAFCGFPQVVKYVSATSLHKKSTASVFCKNLDNKPLNPELGVYGPLNLSVKEQSSHVWGAKLAVLPSDASYQILPGSDASHGKLLLNKWQISNVKCLDDKVSIKPLINGDSVTIECSYTGSSTPQELIKLEIYWAHNPKAAIIQLPFPSSGVMAFDGDSHRIEKRKTLSLRQLYGVRVVSLLSQGNHVEIELNLKDTGGINIEPTTIRLKREKDSSRVEIRLIDYKEQIADLLYAVDQLDTKVEFRLKVTGASDFVLFVNKYEIEFEHKVAEPYFMIKQSQLANFTNEVVERCEVVATRIDESDDIVTLEQSINGGVYSGIWGFPTHKYADGTWMIHPSSNSSIQFRAMILPLRNDTKEVEEDVGSLKFALNIAHDKQREAAINLVLEELTSDFDDSAWQHVEYLAERLGHLNLTSLHLWRLFAKNKRAMAALALRESKFTTQFILRFAAELPFMWELVSLEAWLDAAFYLKKQIFQRYQEEKSAQQYFEYLLQNKLSILLNEYPALNMVFEVIKHKNQLAVNQEMQKAINHPQIFADVFKSQIFEGENSDLQNLLRTKTASWPSDFFNEIRAYKQSEHQHLMCLQDFAFKDPVINFPFVVAINTLTQELPQWLVDESAFIDLKKLKNFDKDWFDSAFDKTIARGITLGYVQL